MKKIRTWIQNDDIQRNNSLSPSEQIAKHDNQIAHTLSFKFVIVGNQENRHIFLKECTAPEQFSNKIIGQEYFIITLANGIQVQVWDMLSASITCSHSRDYILEGTNAVIFLEPETDKNFISRAKINIAKNESINEKNFYDYTFCNNQSTSELKQSPKAFLSEIYSQNQLQTELCTGIQLSHDTVDKQIEELSTHNKQSKIAAIFFKQKKSMKDDNSIELTEMNKKIHSAIAR